MLSHHTELYEVESRDSFFKEVIVYMKKEQVYYEVLDKKKVGIDDVRAIIAFANKNIGARKVMIINCHIIMREAQNALLKTLEEQREDTFFILIISDLTSLFETVRSRFFIMKRKEIGDGAKSDKKDNKKEYLKNDGKDDVKTLAKVYIESKREERMLIPDIISLLEQVDEEDRKDREAVTLFLEKVIQEIIYSPAYMKKISVLVLSDCMEVVTLSKDGSANGKQLLEYMAYRLP